MKQIMASIFVLTFLTACNSNTAPEAKPVENVQGTAVYGDSIKNEQFIQLSSIQTEMNGENKKDLKIRGVVKEVCQEKGCWMTMNMENGDEMRVTFKDYKFFVPKDMSGKEVILDGFVYTDTVSVEKQRHYAEDAGKSQTEIDAITSPKTQLAFEAKGVVVMN